MAIKELRKTWDHCQLDYVRHYIVTTEADIAKLPTCCLGSTCVVSETNARYVCGKGKVWKKQEEAMEEGPGSSGGEDRYKTVTLVSGAVDFEYAEVDGFGISMALIELDSSSVRPGNTLAVEWDGEKYEYPIQWASSVSNGFNWGDIMFGNLAVAGVPTSSSDEPFVIIEQGGNGIAIMDIAATGNVTHNVKIEVSQDCYASHVAFVDDRGEGINRLYKHDNHASGKVWGAKEFMEAYCSERKMLLFNGTQTAHQILDVDVSEMYSKGVKVFYSTIDGDEIKCHVAYTDAEKYPDEQ